MRLLPFDEQRHIVGYLDGFQAEVNALWESPTGMILQAETQEELDAALPSLSPHRVDRSHLLHRKPFCKR